MSEFLRLTKWHWRHDEANVVDRVYILPKWIAAIEYEPERPDCRAMTRIILAAAGREVCVYEHPEEILRACGEQAEGEG